MRTKTIFLTTTALALLASANPASAEDLYISVLGGLNWQHDNSGSQSTTFSSGSGTGTSYLIEPDTGFVLGGTIGTGLDAWLHGLRTEVEVSYRRNDVQGGWTNGAWTTDTNFTFDGGPVNANVSNFAILANVWYDIDMGWKVVPYIGGGAGWSRAHLDGAFAVTTTIGGGLSGDVVFDQVNNGFAYQLGAGFNYEVAPSVRLGMGYRYFNGPNFDPIFIGKNDLAAHFDNDNHSVTANLTIGIN